MARITRSAAQAALLAAKKDPQLLSDAPKPNGTETPTEAKRIRSHSQKNEPSAKKQKTTKSKTETNDLPHNLGSLPSPLTPKSNTGIKREQLADLATDLQSTVDRTTETIHAQQQPNLQKPKKNTYGLTPGLTPFPSYPRPTPTECEQVARLLTSIHGEITPPTTLPEPSLTVTGCGEVPSVLDALIRTLLSGATTGKNSAMAFNGLVQKFGILNEGIGKGSVDWDKVRRAKVEDVFEAIKRGGLADVKSRNLKRILDLVYEENQKRREILTNNPDDPALKSEPSTSKDYEIACAEENVLSLNHLHTLPTPTVMTHLTSYPGIGPKTAACVILFCLQRPCFAVDTHIFRISKWLGWLPPDTASSRVNEVTAFGHLEVRVPDGLKYSLHQLLIRHGKSCARCRAGTGKGAVGWKEGCVIEHLVRRTGGRK
ncbi:endonuclease III domain-containing protein [Aspergillus ruber CBS 135680]|uniref:HhH-GPD family base excision DNA repair protein n=1 Tax=Aspergillus ruber (strain CBS 135680) TaxID=1388766 RepID=A0A017SK97_ASPRC|nr:HhH-GPD family base excision DNA repair protein [Aspergillus ruber CBS 135680]EYE96745.1 HhH-GPD family base excision DNA repair protein [Aspergillus ruber CBS 135680]